MDLSLDAEDTGDGDCLPAIVVMALDTGGAAGCEETREARLWEGDLRARSWSSASFWLA